MNSEGVSLFGITFLSMLTLMLINHFTKCGPTQGIEAVACYACVAYVTTIVYMLLQGVGDGESAIDQPVLWTAG